MGKPAPARERAKVFAAIADAALDKRLLLAILTYSNNGTGVGLRLTNSNKRPEDNSALGG